MSVTLVVDASVSAAWALPDEATPYTGAASQATVGGEIWVPALWQLGVGNLMFSAQRRRHITAAAHRNFIRPRKAR